MDVVNATKLHRTTVTNLYKETVKKVDLNAIQKLCILFECTVGELLEYIPDEDTEG